MNIGKRLSTFQASAVVACEDEDEDDDDDEDEDNG
jgi:hypothetical protein